MLSILLLSALPSPAPFQPTVAAAPTSLQEEDAAAQIAAAGDDVAKLTELAAALKEAGDRAGARKANERILELDAENEVAHKALRHHQYDGKWFTSYAALSKYRREEAKRMKEEHGLVRFNDEWVAEADVPFMRMGWEKVDETWLHPAKVARAKEAAALEAKGWQMRSEDSTWVAPENFDLWRDGMYKVEDEWFTKEEANEYHSKIGQQWNYVGEHFVCRSTLDVDSTSWARWYADKTYDDLVRLYGVEPEEKPVFGVFGNLSQHNNFAAGDQAAQRGASETTGFSSLHYAYLADLWFDIIDQSSIEYIGGGIALWDVNDEALKAWGPFAVRHAAGLSYGEYVDRAWNTVSQFLSQGAGGGGAPASVWDEKKLPRWFVYGGASYVERYYEDKDAAADGGDAWGVRNWAISQLTAKGEPHSLEDIFSMPLDINDIDGSYRYIMEAGLVGAFMMDGGCAPVSEKHEAVKAAIKSGEGATEAVAALQQAILDNEAAFREFAGLGENPAAAPAAEPAAVDAGGGAGH